MKQSEILADDNTPGTGSSNKSSNLSKRVQSHIFDLKPHDSFKKRIKEYDNSSKKA
jgi:hypothetical protein